MVSLVNFANWLRRLKLDFSDVVGQNLAYNSLDGTLHFENGVASLRDPLRMNMPSGRMSMDGDFDMLNEQVEGRLVATLPVATNLPWVVALMGGLPAAAGVYVTSKLVEKQVDRLSSISYKLSGSWDDIEVKWTVFLPRISLRIKRGKRWRRRKRQGRNPMKKIVNQSSSNSINRCRSPAAAWRINPAQSQQCLCHDPARCRPGGEAGGATGKFCPFGSR